MRLVTMTRDMRPWQRGQDVALPNEAAAQLLNEGAANNPRNLDGTPIERTTPAPAKHYRTRKGE
jgi:hypothetical protein